MGIINYSPDLKIVNLGVLPRGTGSRYLLVMRGEGDDLVAVGWRRKKPTVIKGNQLLIEFKKGNGR